MDASPTIVVSAIVIRDATGRILTVRKRGTDRFMFPGGKPEHGEGALQCAMREAREELGVEIDHADLELVGVFAADAANEDGHRVVATVFEHPFIEVSTPAAEIDELRWVEVEAGGDEIAPLLRDAVFPFLRGEVPVGG